MSEKLETYLDEAIQNIRNDRAVTSKLLVEVMEYIKGDEKRHEDVGQVVAKYVETLQRSNEQLVKVAALIQKKTGNNTSLSETDKSEIFDLIQEQEKETA